MFDPAGKPVPVNVLERMSATLGHRGPDGSGLWVSDGIGLAHRRLSIIDLQGGAQPITNEDGTLQLIFNGEIYNFIELRKELLGHGHIFKTKSDTEVIVHAYEQWGAECVNRFNGIFAFALYDGNLRQLLLARDHLGVKPLYYTQAGGMILFASEIKALLAHPECRREVDLQSLSMLFSLRYVPSPETMFADIKKLPPGHYMVAGRRGVEVKRYWRWTPQIRPDAVESELVVQYQDLLEDAVRLQMRSDVPVGLFLSSGIDSGVLLALMSKYSGEPVRTFTIGFENGEASNETDDARAMAAAFGAEHTEMIVSPRDYETYYRRYLWDIEEPVGNESAAAFYFVSHIAAAKVKVALTGQGADEPWAGYQRYLGVKLSQTYSRLPAGIKESIRRVVESCSSNETLLRGVTSLSERDVLSRFVKIYSFYSSSMKAQLFQPWLAAEISCNGHESERALNRLHQDVKHLDPLTQILYIDTRANLADDLLMVGDKTSMANSLEARVPFLDYRLVEFIETLPPSLKLRGMQGKYLHKKALAKWLPKQVVHRKKKGFANPVAAWLRSSMLPYVNECLLSADSAVSRYFETSYLRRLVAEHQTGQKNNMRQLYLLMSFEMWHQQFIQRQPLAPEVTALGAGL